MSIQIMIANDDDNRCDPLLEEISHFCNNFEINIPVGSEK